MKTIQQSILHLTDLADWHERRSPNGPEAVTVPVCAADLRAVLARVVELEHAIKVCHADATNGIGASTTPDADLQSYLLSIQITAGNAIA